jgi:hypothetical protein|tara:strand:+ start:156 stop:473 length:318 start_codon:yes stop_codon:yes gene_type:complete
MVKKKVGRPKKELDTKLIERLSSIFCTNEEIASVVECHADTLADNFSEYLKKGRSRGKMSLRRMQWEKAQTGNTTMLIWLGKQMLGQKDRLETSEEAQPLPWSYD